MFKNTKTHTHISRCILGQYWIIHCWVTVLIIDQLSWSLFFFFFTNVVMAGTNTFVSMWCWIAGFLFIFFFSFCTYYLLFVYSLVLWLMFTRLRTSTEHWKTQPRISVNKRCQCLLKQTRSGCQKYFNGIWMISAKQI